MDKYDYIHSDKELKRVTPIHQAMTGIGGITRHIPTDFTAERTYINNRPHPEAQTNRRGMESFLPSTSREKVLRPTIQMNSEINSGLESRPTMPILYHDNDQINLESNQTKLRKSVFDMQMDRQQTLANIPYQPVIQSQ
jgi:hypothetical protein